MLAFLLCPRTWNGHAFLAFPGILVFRLPFPQLSFSFLHSLYLFWGLFPIPCKEQIVLLTLKSLSFNGAHSLLLSEVPLLILFIGKLTLLIFFIYEVIFLAPTSPPSCPPNQLESRILTTYPSVVPK